MSKFPYEDIVVKAIRDEQFKQALMEAPGKAIQREFKLDQRVDVEVVTDSKDLIHIVVPATAGLRGDESGPIKLFLEHLRANPKRLKQFKQEPHEVLNRAFGFSIPKHINLKVVEESEDRRVVHLPAMGAEKIGTTAEAEAFWGGGGGDDEPWLVGTYGSGQVCMCYTPGDDMGSDMPRCCLDGTETAPPQTQTPDGGGYPRL